MKTMHFYEIVWTRKSGKIFPDPKLNSISTTAEFNILAESEDEAISLATDYLINHIHNIPADGDFKVMSQLDGSQNNIIQVKFS